MKSLFRCCLLLAIVALMAVAPLASARTANAQDAMCFGLSAENCELFAAVPEDEGAAKLAAFTMDYAITAKVAGTGTNDVDFSVQGSGPFAIDPTAMTASASNPMAALGGLTTQQKMTASLTAEGKTQKGVLEFRIVGGKLYFMGDMATQNKWMSLDLAAAIAQYGSMASGMMGGGASGASNPAMAAMSDPEVMAAIANLPKVPGFIKAERKDDIDIGGVKSAQFVVNFDLLALVKSKEFTPILKAAMKSSGSTTEMTDQQLAQIVGVAQTFLKDTKLSITRYVSAEDKMPRGLGLNFSMKIDEASAAMAGMTGSKGLDINFTFDVKLSKLGEKVTVEAVKDAQEVPMGGGMGSGVATPEAKP
jgi:hypothetical protein